MPAEDQFQEKVDIAPGHCYVVKTQKGNYAKFRIMAIKDRWMDDINGIAIEYLYQADGALTFSK